MKASLKDLGMELWLRARNSGAIKWTTKDGNVIAIKDMTDSHLVNTINMIRRAKEERELEEFLLGEAGRDIQDTF